MRIVRIVTRRVHSFLRRSTADAELQREIEIHIQQLTSEAMASGMAEAEARTVALREFGPVDRIKEQCRDTRRVSWIQHFARDLLYGLRMLRDSPGFTAVAVLTLALGIGANTAIFSIVDAVLLRSLPYPDPNQLVLMFDVPLNRPDALSAISYRDLTECRRQNHVFTEMAGNTFHDLTLTGAGEPAIVNTADVTPEIFPLLNAKPLAGRLLLPEDGRPGAVAVAVLSENLWRSRFGSDPGLIGRSIALDMRSFTVVGILPASFRYPDGAPRQDVWISVMQDPLFGPLTSQPGVRLLGVIGRLKAGVSLAKAQAEMHTVGARLAKEFPAEDAEIGIRIKRYREVVVGNLKFALLILLSAVGLVLLMACANVANLLLSRATSRGREIAVRTALGASRAHIVRQLLTESALLGLLGRVAGVLLAALVVWGLQPFWPPEVVRIGSISVGGRVLAFTLLLSLVAALAFGLAPALIATPSNLQANMKEGGERTSQRGGRRLRSLLAIAEISLAMVLLVGGGLLIRSFARVTSANPGFDPNNVIEAEVSLPQFEYSTPPQWTAFADELLARLHAQPGFEDCALAAPLPMDRQGEATFTFSIVGNPMLPPGKSTTADYATVSPDYFRVMRIPLLRGRLFSGQDSASNRSVAVISETWHGVFSRTRTRPEGKFDLGFRRTAMCHAKSSVSLATCAMWRSARSPVRCALEAAPSRTSLPTASTCAMARRFSASSSTGIRTTATREFRRTSPMRRPTGASSPRRCSRRKALRVCGMSTLPICAPGKRSRLSPSHRTPIRSKTSRSLTLILSPIAVAAFAVRPTGNS